MYVFKMLSVNVSGLCYADYGTTPWTSRLVEFN